jgi:hypothetical protein
MPIFDILAISMNIVLGILAVLANLWTYIQDPTIGKRESNQNRRFVPLDTASMVPVGRPSSSSASIC